MNRQIQAMIFGGLLLAVPGCGAEDPAATTAANDPQEMFLAQISRHCDNAYKGELVSEDPADADFASQEMIIHIRDCSEEGVRIHLHVGEDRSRTWHLTRTEAGVQLKHHHLHEDGKPDAVTFYGGVTLEPGTARRQEFPADQYSKDLFVQEGLEVSTANVWAMEVVPETLFAYELRRPNRFFRAEFDLGTPVPLPPPA